MPILGAYDGDGSAAVEIAAPYTSSQVPVIAYNQAANASVTATMPAVANRTNYVTGFEITSSGATAVNVVNATLTGILGGPIAWNYGVNASGGGANPTLQIAFNPPLVGAAVNTAITLTLPALGAGNTGANVVIHGYYQ